MIEKMRRREFIKTSSGLLIPSYLGVGKLIQEAKRLPLFPTGGITPPSLISYTEIAWTGNTAAPRSTAGAVAWNSGDIIVVIAGTEGPGQTWAAGTVTATGLTFTLQKSNNVAGTCSSAVWTAAPGAGGSQTFTVNPPGGGQDWGAAIWVFRSSGGVGNTGFEQHTATRLVSYTATQAHSAIVWATFDFAAVTTNPPVATPTPTNIRQNVKDGTHYTLYVSDLTDQASAGAVSYGITGSGTGPFSIIGIEVKGI